MWSCCRRTAGTPCDTRDTHGGDLFNRVSMLKPPWRLIQSQIPQCGDLAAQFAGEAAIAQKINKAVVDGTSAASVQSGAASSLLGLREFGDRLGHPGMSALVPHLVHEVEAALCRDQALLYCEAHHIKRLRGLDPLLACMV